MKEPCRTSRIASILRIKWKGGEDADVDFGGLRRGGAGDGSTMLDTVAGDEEKSEDVRLKNRESSITPRVVRDSSKRTHNTGRNRTGQSD